jgi:hypothetical protein
MFDGLAQPNSMKRTANGSNGPSADPENETLSGVAMNNLKAIYLVGI